MFDVIIAAESNCSGGGVGSHGHERPKDQIYFGHHEYAEKVIDWIVKGGSLVFVVEVVGDSLEDGAGMGQN